MSGLDVAGLILLAGLAWLWYDSSGAREAGIDAVRAACASENLQLLDDTVAMSQMKPERNRDGRLTLRRVYTFEYSDTGNNRRQGSVVLLGARVIVVNIGLRLVASNATLH